MCELWRRVIINERSELTMLLYANIFCERSKPGGDNSEHSNLREASGSAVSARFERIDSV